MTRIETVDEVEHGESEGQRKEEPEEFGSEAADGVDMPKADGRVREVGVEVVDTIVKTDNEPVLTSLIES